MELVTGKKGEAHVTSLQFRNVIRAIAGTGSYIANAYDNCAATLQQDGATLQVAPGIIIHHGCVYEIPYGTLDEITLIAGAAASKRRDLVCIRWTQDGETGIETADWVVIEGTPASSPVDPAYNATSMQEGALIDDCPVFRVSYDGLNISGVETLLEVMPQVADMETMQTDIADNATQITYLRLEDRTMRDDILAAITRANTAASKANTLQTAVNTLATSKNLTVTGSFGLTARFYRRGHIVFAWVQGNPSGLTTTGWKNICTVTNSDFIPAVDMHRDTKSSEAGGTEVFLINMQADGNLRINPLVGAISGRIDVTYTYYV